ncbi:MAG: TIGR01621 family pseudouridine synthase [Deltaproteobacteria bacterium]|nr:MAG: TIGR01621 family pseudouridine synthase [Deltaproteobacteria bacterium]
MRHIPVLYSSERILVIDKPAGLAFHQRAEEAGIMQVLREQQRQEALPEGELFPVHRLDAITSGVLVLARDREMASLLGEAFAQRQVDKVYLALASRRPSKKQGWIKGDMERSRRGTWKLKRSAEQPAITRFVSYAIPGDIPGLRLFVLKPETGKTHQLRVAMKSLGSPVLGDALYGASDHAATFDRTYLHACALRCSVGEETLEVVCWPTEGHLFGSAPVQQVFETIESPFSLWG